MNKEFLVIPFFIFIIALIPQVNAEPNDSVVVLETWAGEIVIEFFPDDAPNHVDNFLKLSNDGFYDGTYFHRIIYGFMIQGGDPKSAQPGVAMSEWGTGDPGYSIDAEFNNISHERGIVSMARSNDPNSAGSQFFIVHKDSTFLDGQYTVFGRIITQESFDTLDYIAELQTMPNDQAVQTRDAALITSTVKDRSEISNILDLNPPTRTGTSIMSTEPETYTNNYFGVSFTSPIGWLIQTPPKTEPSVPDLLVLGTQTDSSSPAISISIDGTSGTLEDEIQKFKNKMNPLIEQNVFTPQNEQTFSVDKNPAHLFQGVGTFENLNDEFREIGFTVILFVNDGKVYTIQYSNHSTDFNNYLDEFNDFIESFELIDSGPDSTTYELDTNNQETDSQLEEGGGCLIATAAYGSEMAPQIQFLREIRDGKIMTTQSGTAFMTGFNQFYYLFSPAVADYERENPLFKEAVKVSLTPMLTSLTLLNYVDVDSEQEILGYGIGIILLNIGMYFVAPTAAILVIKNRIKRQ